MTTSPPRRSSTTSRRAGPAFEEASRLFPAHVSPLSRFSSLRLLLSRARSVLPLPSTPSQSSAQSPTFVRARQRHFRQSIQMRHVQNAWRSAARHHHLHALGAGPLRDSGDASASPAPLFRGPIRFGVTPLCRQPGEPGRRGRDGRRRRGGAHPAPRPAAHPRRLVGSVAAASPPLTDAILARAAAASLL
jgi:hypothetical protein